MKTSTDTHNNAFHKSLKDCEPFSHHNRTDEYTEILKNLTLQCEDANQFLNELNLSGDQWRPPETIGTESPQKDQRRNQYLVPEWLFRGQRENQWELLPKPWRSPRDQVINELSCFTTRTDRLNDGEDIHLHDLLHAEEEILEKYSQTLQFSGHLNPIEEQNQSNEVRTIAQHRGVPTRLLDWTTMPHCAAFMAARGLYESSQTALNLDSSKSISIWVINQKTLGSLSRRASSIDENPDEAFLKAFKYGNHQLISPNACLDERVVAQRGCFTNPLEPFRFVSEFGQFPEIDQFILNGLIYEKMKIEQDTSSFCVSAIRSNFISKEYLTRHVFPHLRRLTLPNSEVHKLMECLDVMGFHESAFFPGLNQISIDLKHRALRKQVMLGGGIELTPVQHSKQ